MIMNFNDDDYVMISFFGAGTAPARAALFTVMQ